MEAVKDYYEVMSFLSCKNNNPKKVQDVVKDYDSVKETISNPERAKKDLAIKRTKEILAELRRKRRIEKVRKIHPIDNYELRTYTYIAADKRNGLYKIGKSTDLYKRQKNFTKAINDKSKSQPLLDIEIIYYSERSIETYLHQLFYSRRVRDSMIIEKYYPRPAFQGIRTEWFALEQKDIDFMIEKFNFKPFK